MRLKPETKPEAQPGLRAAAMWLLLVLFFLSARTGNAQDIAVPEADAKAAFLYNFVKFVEWPAKAFPSESTNITVAVFGDDDFAATLSTLLKDKKAHGRSFSVRKAFTTQEAKDAQVVFIAAGESKRAAQILDGIKNAPTLTIGESEQFANHGGMINFYFEDKQLRFEINVAAAEKANLNISSKLLRLAKPSKGKGK